MTASMDNLSPIILVVLAFFIYRWYSRPSLEDIPGPPPESFWIGNLRQLRRYQVGQTEFGWHKQYGGVARIKGAFGTDSLWVSDPAALRYIYQVSAYKFPKLTERRVLSRLIGDEGLDWAEGETHRRQRKVLQPAFGTPESKALVPVFVHHAQRLVQKWKDVAVGTPDKICVINVAALIGLATLDAICEAAFDYKPRALDNADNELAQSYKHLIAGIALNPSDQKIIFQNVIGHLPEPFVSFIYGNLPGDGIAKARKNKEVAHKIAHQLLETKLKDVLSGKGNRDVMSILVKANASENDTTKLSHYEMMSQMRTLMLAGQETTSNTLSFALLELAQHPQYQDRLRAEIQARAVNVRNRGDVDFTAADMEAMPFLQAVVKEVLRFHPVLPNTLRCPEQDDVIPLSKPIATLSGKVIDRIPVRKGLRLVLSIAAYNRNPEVWGDDAHIFNPDRFLIAGDKRNSSVGVMSNLLTFAGGVRACIGWRFAVYELQAFLIELIANLRFSTTDDIQKLRRENAVVMVPTLEGEAEKGVQLPLKVSLAEED